VDGGHEPGLRRAKHRRYDPFGGKDGFLDCRGRDCKPPLVKQQNLFVCKRFSLQVLFVEIVIFTDNVRQHQVPPNGIIEGRLEHPKAGV
jgi:hypothetical protein